MPEHEDSLGGETFSGEEQQGPAEQSLGDGATMGGDTAAHSLGDQSTFGDTNVDDELFDDGMEIVDLSTRYTEEGVLGKGGFGEVILATDNRLERKVAIKRIQGKAARSKIAVQRFLTEAKSIAALSHNNIVQIYDYGRSTDGPFLIMECVQGGSLLDLTRKGPIELDEAVNIFSQVCDGLAKAHAENIIHRDIKPANILMTGDGIPKLTDFGLAKDDTADTGMTMEGAVIGTLDFMPPEQRRGAEFTDHRSDLWSLAATFYQMLTGKSPKVINITSLPQKLQSVVAKALEESKEDRFQSVLEMREAVLDAHSGKMATSRSLGEGECPQCATVSPPDQKFCRNCSAQLQVNCLGCQKEIAIWDNGCGACGAQQAPLMEKALADLKNARDQAESLLIDLEFEAAEKQAKVVVSHADSRLQQYAGWREEFSTRLESSRTSEHARLAELLREAHAHEQAYDYEAGLQTLEQIAPTLKQTTARITSSAAVTADVLTERLTTKLSRLKELEGIVRDRVSKREITALLPIVDELLMLKLDRPEVQKLKMQLEKREANLVEVRENACRKATQQLGEQQYAEAVATLNAVSAEVLNEQLKDLKVKANDLLNQLNNLRDSIKTAVNGNQLKGLLPVIEECLILKADQDELVKLRQELIDLEAQADARNQQIISQAQAHIQQVQFAEAAKILGTIAKEEQTSSTIELYQFATAFGKKRQTTLSDAKQSLFRKDYGATITRIGAYLQDISSAGLKDSRLQRMLKDAVKRQAAVSRKRLFVIGSLVTASILVLAVGGLIATSLVQGSIISEALEKGDFQAVLDLDPTNPEALSMKSRKIAEELRIALDNGYLETAMSLDPTNSEVLAMKKNSVAKALAMGDFKTALSLDAGNNDAAAIRNAGAAIRRSLKSQEDHTDAVHSVAFSPDGNTIVSGSGNGDKSIKLWNSQDGSLKASFLGQSYYTKFVAFSSDGTRIISHGAPGRDGFKLWDSQTGALLDAEFGPKYASEGPFAISADRKTIASGVESAYSGPSTRDYSITIWDSQTGTEIGTITARSKIEGIGAIALSPDGKTLVTAEESTVTIWETQTGVEITTIDVGRDRRSCIALSPDGSAIAFPSTFPDVIYGVKVWNRRLRSEQSTLDSHRSRVNEIIFSVDGKTIITGSQDKTIKFWSSRSGVEILTLEGHSRWITSMALSPDGNRLVSGDEDGGIRIWNIGRNLDVINAVMEKYAEE